MKSIAYSPAARKTQRAGCCLRCHAEILAYAGSGRGYGFLPALWSMVPHEGVVFAAAADIGAAVAIAAYWLPQLETIVAPTIARLGQVAEAGLQGFLPNH